LDWTREITALKYVRFHAIFHDENGVYDEDAQGNPIYNFSYVDQIYDGLLAHGVKPFVELGFMPKKLAANPVLHAFWYKPSPAPPKDYSKWDALITAFVQHLVERYGLDEVAQWYFEVWNEPNIDFWSGEPKQATYLELHDQIKASARPSLPLIWSEYNASYKNEPEITDQVFMAPWLANTIRQCDGLVDIMSYWTFSDVFEEQGVVKTPFYGGFGIIAAGGLPKPAFNAFKVLHWLGEQRLAVDSNMALATLKAGSPVLAAWNLVLP